MTERVDWDFKHCLNQDIKSLDVFTFKDSISFMSVNYLKMASDSK